MVSLLENMNRILYIGTFFLLFGIYNTQADEGYDPIIYESEEEADGNLFSIIPPTPIKVGIGKKDVIEPKSEETKSSAPITNEENLKSHDITDTTITHNYADVPAIPTKADSTQSFESINNQDLSEDASSAPLIENIQPENKPNTWISNTLDALKSTSDDVSLDVPSNSLENMLSNSRNNKKRANASVFDISGVMLRMTLPQVEEALKIRKFTKVAEKFEIPNFIKWRNEEKCRNNGVVGYERLNSCVVTLSKKDGHQYPETVKFARFDTKEEIIVKLTSNFSNNKVYRIYYNSLSPSITGNSAKATYLRNIKVYDFWKKINQKYGTPDNKDEVVWGLGGNKPYLKASSGKLLLDDPMFLELDYTRMSREDQRFMNTDLFNF